MDSLLTEKDIEEALSAAYAHAVAASAGYVVATRNFDRDGVDLTIEVGDTFRPKIDVQLKATINLDPVGEVFRYPLRQRNYDLLRIETQTPRILVVLKLPQNRGDWLTLTPENLILRNCAYWTALVGSPATDNESSTTIDIPVKNSFDTKSLKELMEKSRTGSLR
ncbi:DUF4365 domain-containing protein [Mesorhizobium sp. M1A.F.Ca.IN.020.06.1.1]|uniref:DUF4365 domain-containing protein n=1 Tax=Mesorhizobium sp. M1A.F.Ca.IN.020.06.1.1 TaxID=2496765 RepID=UPI000FD2CBBB|nr:DUF4365 domain-containing protein [Mesorhizobium sp. M1A.F.Ca.IN.020.06.1.1]RUW26680.1 DUF4365 domain-containing protein [Mesorhizobium sp. M1A.F.Ca.IN.020.06.1.1]